ncbi:MAG: glycosyltransferase family 1 protein [Acetobacter sp.]
MTSSRRMAIREPDAILSEHDISAPVLRSLPLRVAIVASSYNYIRDGVALTMNRLVGYLESQGVEVRIYTPVSKQPAFDYKGTVIPVPSIALPGRSEYRLAFGLSQEEIEKFKPDLIHVALAPDPLGYSTLRIARKLKIPLVASYHTRYETYLKYYPGLSIFTSPLKRYLSKYYSNCQEIYVPTQSMIDTLVVDNQKGNLILWSRGVDAETFNPVHRSKDWRTRHGISSDEVIVLFVSRLVREKQLGIFASTIKALKARNIPVRPIIAGDGPARAELEREIPDAIFLGFQQGQDLATTYASSDIFLFPSETETFGNVTLEAMASGLPCVCADATGSQSLVQDGVTGFLAIPQNVDDFVMHVADIALDPIKRARMSEAARARALTFSWDETMKNLLARYETVVRTFH